MKNLNKKIGVVALAGMMIAGGFIGNIGIAQASQVGSIQGIAKRPNLYDHKYVREVCGKLGIKVLISSINEKDIDAYIEKEMIKYVAKDENIIRKLSDLEIEFERDEKDALIEYLEYLKEKKDSRRVHRFKFGHEQYLVLINAK